MSDRTKKAPEVREPVCLLCGRSEADPDICGEKMQKYGLCAHVFCLFFAKLFLQRNKKVGFLGLLPKDIQYTVDQAAQKNCCICGQRGATISCCETDCDLSFHLPCAKQGGCVTQFMPPYRAFCPTHRPEQTVEATPEPGTECLICMEPVEDRKTFNTTVCPACKTTWFHRNCIQNQAIHSGFSIFCCPHCQNEYRFLMEMFMMGIRIPRRRPSWEEEGAYGQLYERHSHCNASECLFPGGRQEAEKQGPWQLLLCSSCAAEGTHRHCSGLRDSTTSWECDGCAGLGTAASRDDSELSMDKQMGLEPSHSLRAPDTISPSTDNLVPAGLSHRSLAPETSSQDSLWNLPL